MRKRILAIAGIAVLVIGATVFALGHGLQGYGQGRGERRQGPGPEPGNGRSHGQRAGAKRRADDANQSHF